MKYFYWILFVFAHFSGYAQKMAKQVLQVRLPPELIDGENQFSGMIIQNQKLYFLAESRIQQGHEARMFALPLQDVEQQLTDEKFDLKYEKIPIIGLASLEKQMAQQHQSFEGLEAVTAQNGFLYFSVETPTKDENCFLLKGKLLRDTVFLDTSVLIPLLKPRGLHGEAIHNAGFESLLVKKDRLVALYEFNLFSKGNFAYRFRPEKKVIIKDSVPMQPLPFRLTDVTHLKGNRYVGINYFYWHPEDSVYRPRNAYPTAEALVNFEGVYKSYTRLVSLKVKAKKISWKPLFEFPVAYRPFNWEGIAAWNGGFLVINDKYTPEKPFVSTLLFVKL